MQKIKSKEKGRKGGGQAENRKWGGVGCGGAPTYHAQQVVVISKVLKRIRVLRGRQAVDK